MRTVTKALLGLNGVALAFVVLWLLVSGGGRGYFGGGAASEVDGILLLFLGLFNLAFLAAVLLALPGPSPSVDGKSIKDAVTHDVFSNERRFHETLRTWSGWALCVNGVLVLFVGLWLLVSSDRRGYFQANATQVDMILLFLLSVLNILHMGVAYLWFSAPAKSPTET